MITESKITEIFCIADDFCKEFEAKMVKNALLPSPDAPKNRRSFGECTGISFVDSTCIPVIHNKCEFNMKVFKGIASKGISRSRFSDGCGIKEFTS